MAKYKIYAVGYGVDPDTHTPVYGIKCTKWPDCQKYIKNVADAKYKGFLTDDEADAWIQQIKENIGINPNLDNYSNPDTSDWQAKAVKLHPVDQEFLTTCQDLGLSIHDTEHLMKMIFVNIVKYLKDNDCINELSFEEE